MKEYESHSQMSLPSVIFSVQTLTHWWCILTFKVIMIPQERFSTTAVHKISINFGPQNLHTTMQKMLTVNKVLVHNGVPVHARIPFLHNTHAHTYSTYKTYVWRCTWLEKCYQEILVHRSNNGYKGYILCTHFHIYAYNCCFHQTFWLCWHAVCDQDVLQPDHWLYKQSAG